jgi:Flp pilus assembly protein TadD
MRTAAMLVMAGWARIRIAIGWGILLACVCLAQTKQPSLEELDAALLKDLRGGAEARLGPAVGSSPSQIEPPASHSDRPSGSSVSVTQLQHKPPKQAQQCVARGARFSRLGDHERAAAEFEKAITRDPQYANAHDRLGVEYAQLRRLDEGETELRCSIGLDAAAWAAHYDLAVILYQKGDFAGAERSVRRALDLSSTNAQAHLLLGLLLWRHAETSRDALAHLKNAARTLPQAQRLLKSLSEE